MIIKRKQFSEAIPSGVSYVHGPDDKEHIYVLDSADKLLDIVDNSYLGKIEAVNKKTNIFKRAVRPTKEYILYKRRKNQKREN